MTTHTFPTLSRSVPEFNFGMIFNSMSFSSPLSKAIQTIEMPGARWQFSFSYENLEEEDAALVQGFLMQLRGQAGRFYMHNLARPVPRGTALGAPLVKGAAQTGTSLITDAWTASQTAALKIGDMFSVNGELKMVVSANVASDGTGEATIVFEPPLRASPADNAPLTLASPTAIFKLTADDYGWRTVAPVWTSFGIQGEEVL